MNKYITNTERIKEDLYQRVLEFMVKNGIHCGETIYQCDWVIENAYEFIEDLFNITRSSLPLTDCEE